MPPLLSQLAKPGVSLKTVLSLSHPPTWICVPTLAQPGCSAAVAAGDRVHRQAQQRGDPKTNADNQATSLRGFRVAELFGS